MVLPSSMTNGHHQSLKLKRVKHNLRKQAREEVTPISSIFNDPLATNREWSTCCHFTPPLWKSLFLCVLAMVLPSSTTFVYRCENHFSCVMGYALAVRPLSLWSLSSLLYLVIFSVHSKRSCPTTSTQKFAEEICKAMMDLKNLFDAWDTRTFRFSFTLEQYK